MSSYRVFCDDLQVAVVSGPSETCLREAFHYAAQYRKDGRVTIKKGRELIAIFSQDRSDPTTPDSVEQPA